MAVVKILGLALSLAAAVLGAPHGPEEPAPIEARQANPPHWYKYWANSQAVVESEDLDGGEFTVEWDEPTGGNFVIGKGYQQGFAT
jgi:endo-1,4-beta-xylanase